MILLVSGSMVPVGKLAKRWPDRLGHLLTPSNRNSVASVLKTGLSWAVDNGAFSGFDPIRFRSLLRRTAENPRCLWVVCPDKVAEAAPTLRLFDQWQPEIAALGLPVAFVAQDGQECLPVPWDRCACLFIGGTTRWKLSPFAARLAREAKERGKWVHVGRVNSRRRMQSALDIGADSIDGSSASMFGDKYIHKYCLWLQHLERQQTVFT